MPGAAGQAALKARLKKLHDISFRLGTGSLEGIGLRMASFPGWTAASGFLVEGTQFLQWLQAEFGINKAIATQLWERMSWQRDVVNGQRSFSMACPFLGVCGALHLEDLWALYTQADPLGLRGRLCLFYTRPVMKRAREIEAANEQLGNHRGSNALERLLVEKFYPMYQAHAVEHRGDEAFVEHLGYVFINYSFSPADDNAAMKLFMQNFDTHVQLQEENYLVQHEDSKSHGKLKGKHLRHALNWHNLINAHAGTQFDAWPTCLSVEALQAAELIGRHCEKVAAKINIFAASLKNTTHERPPQPPPAEAARQRTHGALISELRTLQVGQLRYTSGCLARPHIAVSSCSPHHAYIVVGLHSPPVAQLHPRQLRRPDF